jgi:uncharacterized repeat protein (TIGR03806 family)
LTAAFAYAAVLAACGGGPDTVQNTPPPPSGGSDTTAPSVPGNLRNGTIGTTSIPIGWDASTDTGGSGLAGYQLTRNGAQIGGTITGTTFTDTGLTPQTAYTYVVRAVDNAGNVSAASTSLQITTASNNPPTSGLDARGSNLTCLAPDEPVINVSVNVTQFTNLTFTRPVLMLQRADDNTKWYVVEKPGVVRVIANDPNANTMSTYMDLTSEASEAGQEMGLLGMAFDPNYPTNHRVYFSLVAEPSPNTYESRLLRFTENTPGTLTNRELLLTIQQPFTNHKGGNIAFGPDGMLYAAFGDGGSGGDPDNHSQNRSELLGKMIRIDVNGSGAYTIPADNPYAGGTRCQTGTTGGGGMCQEIYAYGFRNPWRWSFDGTDLWVGDVGQDAWEEVDKVQKGGNYGWRLREGKHCFNPSTNCPTTANGAPLIDPVAEYDHNVGVSITGGYVYRGSAIASLQGRYVFGEFSNGKVFTLDSNFQRAQIAQPNAGISSFGQGNDGELYIVDFGGKLFKIVPGAGGGAGNGIPTLLSQSGCFQSANPTQPVDALIPYAPIAPFWSDGAEKARWIGLPDGQNITVNGTTGDWDFPPKTVLVKNFTLNGNLIETRLFMRFADTGNWAGYSYQWNAQHTDATLVTTSTDVSIGGQTYTFPSPAQCLQCHTSAAGRSLGLETRQLNSSFTYTSTGRTANQMDTLEHIGAFNGTPARLTPLLPNPFDTAAPLTDRARAYLHTNCSQCHRPGGGTPVNMDLQFTTTIGNTGTCNVAPTAGDLGVAGAKIIAPGDSAHSVLFLRMSRRGANQMPPLATHVRDQQGETLLQQWIDTGMNGTCQ